MKKYEFGKWDINNPTQNQLKAFKKHFSRLAMQGYDRTFWELVCLALYETKNKDKHSKAYVSTVNKIYLSWRNEK